MENILIFKMYRKHKNVYGRHSKPMEIKVKFISLLKHKHISGDAP